MTPREEGAFRRKHEKLSFNHSDFEMSAARRSRGGCIIFREGEGDLRVTGLKTRGTEICQAAEVRLSFDRIGRDSFLV